MARRKNKLSEEDIAEKKKLFAQVAETLEEIPVDKFLKNNFLPYAWSYNLDRALVDMSGLKPVQRRILYTMFEDKLSPRANRMKVATLGGRVLAYHPHGDTSVVDALKNMAREHVFRVPLIDGKGDFGVPGTPGAAGRYIEARLNEAAWINVEEISEHAVPMIDSYDGTKKEPLRIPVRWPVALINGGQGIATAYSANMPSHNPTEVMEACRALLKNNELTDEELMGYIKGPDYNMGGTITNLDGVREYIATGKGSFRLRGNYEIKQRERNSVRIEFYEIPFGTNPEKILKEIQTRMTKDELFKDVATFKNLSDLKHPIRITIDTKPNTNYRTTLQELFKYTSLETTISANVTTIVDDKPQQSSMRELILEFIEFRKYCVRNKSLWNVDKKKDRLHLVEGLLLVLLDVDKAIAIIRGSDDVDAARQALMKAFKIDEDQASHILELQLRRLTKMDVHALESEKEKLEKEIQDLNDLIDVEAVMVEHLEQEFQETEKVIGDERRTDIDVKTQAEIAALEKQMKQESRAIEKNSPCFVTRFHDGTLMKTMEAFIYEEGERKFEHGLIQEQLKVRTQESVAVILSSGRAVQVPLTSLPMGLAVDATMMGVKSQGGERLVGMAKMNPMKSDVAIIMGTRQGEVKLTNKELPNKAEFPIFRVKDGDEIIYSRYVGRTMKGSRVATITSGGNILLYEAESLRAAGSAAGGVKSQRLGDGETVVSFTWLSAPQGDEMILSQTPKTIKLTPLAEIPAKGRGSQGVILHKFRKGEDKLTNAGVGSSMVALAEGLGTPVNLPAATHRAATGMDFTLPLNMGARNTQVM